MEEKERAAGGLAPEELYHEMAAYDAGDPMRIQHFTKVWTYARLIGLGEGLDKRTQYILETAAILHDIGIHPAEAKYGSSAGKYQEELGPGEAGKLLSRLHYSPEVIDRVCFLIGHHHTYDTIEGADYQILVEADFLVNLYEDGLSTEAAKKACEKIFVTETGKAMWTAMYGKVYEAPVSGVV